jgi:succinoglycan biosynthesis protein ExoM
MSAATEHISVCICTFKRPSLLKRLLGQLDRQHRDGSFDFSVIVADNDYLQSARQVVLEFAASSCVSTVYCVEPQQNIALARNMALQNSKGDFIAFIDDDEFPTKSWLCNLFKACREWGADGVLGPVMPYFEHEPPKWVVEGRFFDRPVHKNGYKLEWHETRTGNVLFRRSILDDIDQPFRAEFGTGSEDVDFFRRMMQKGCVFVWCNEAPVYEVIPPARCRRSYLLKLALLRGGNSAKHPTRRTLNLAKALIAVPLYTVSLPVLLLLGHHIAMKYLIKLLDHGSRIFAFFGWHLVQERKT